jgi:hypothetical protein
MQIKPPVPSGSTSPFDAASDERGADGGGSGRRGGETRKEISETDPQATWIARKGIDTTFYYDANYLIDNRFGIIVDAEGTRSSLRSGRKPLIQLQGLH